MSREKAFYISSKILGEAYEAYEELTMPAPYVCVAAGLEVMKCFSNVADYIIGKWNLTTEEKTRLLKMNEKIEKDRAGYIKELGDFENRFDTNQMKDDHFRRMAKNASSDLKMIKELLDNYDIEADGELFEYQRRTIRIYSRMINYIV